MQLSEFTAKDLEVLEELQPEGWQDIRPSFRFYLNSPFCHPIRFSISDRIVGVGCSILHDKTAWLAHIIVHREFRNQGIGKRITQVLLDRTHKGRIHTVFLIATELGMHVYKKLGFEKEMEYYFFKKNVYHNPAPLSENIRSSFPEFNGDILDLDKMVSGEDRSSLLREHLKEAKVFINKGKLLGYYLPDLGEGLIGANDPAAGLELLKLRVEKFPTVVLPEENEHGVGFLKENDFALFQKGTRMRLGSAVPFKAQMLYSRIAGNLG